MSLPDQSDEVGFQSLEGDEEGSATANNLNTSKLSQAQQKLKNSQDQPFKNIVIVVCIVLVFGIIFYSILNVILRSERQKYAKLQTSLQQQSQALKAEKSNNTELEASNKILQAKLLKYFEVEFTTKEQIQSQTLKIKELQANTQRQSQSLTTQRSKSAELSATIKEQAEKIAEKQKTIDSLTNQVASLRNSLKTLSEDQQKVKAESSAPKPEATKSETAIAKADPNNPNVVIDIEYATDGYAPLPINPLRVNHEGKRVDDACYKDEAARKKRIEFMHERFKFVSSYTHLISLVLAKYNLINSEEQLKNAIKDNQKEWLRLQNKFRLSSVKEELPMCVIVPGYNNNANFRIEYNLNSIFTQNYTNYKVVIINDASTDGSDPLYHNYFSFYAIDKQRYTYIQNSRRATALQNIYLASINHCSTDSIVVTLDGDDEFIGRNVLQVFNLIYQTQKTGVIYSNFYWFLQPQRAWQGFTIEYTDQQKKERRYREVKQKFSQLRSWRAELVHQINSKDLQDDKGAFFTSAYDMALMFPLMQLSCTRVKKIQSEFHYLYNRGTGLNDDVVEGWRQIAVDNLVRKRKRYDCYKDFDERMNKSPVFSSDNSIVKDNEANRIIDIEYASENGPLPINLMRKNVANEIVQNVLYKDEEIRKKRAEFMAERIKFVDANPSLSNLQLAKYNLVNSEEQLKKAIEDNQKDWLRLEAKFGLSKIKEELSMCIIVPTFNNNARFRIQSNLNSIFTQNYTNYKVVVINDASLDNSDEIFRNFFSFHAIDKQRYIYIQNNWRVYALQNTYFASMNHCSKDSIVLIVSGDDELIGRNTLKVFNWAYQTKKAGVVYSNFYNYQQPQSVKQGWTTEYPQDVKKNNLFRSTPSKYSQLRTYRNQLIFNIDVKDLKTAKGFFFTTAYDYPLFIAMMEMSCGRVHKIEEEIHYLYNTDTGLNDHDGPQSEVASWVRQQKKYECVKDFDQRMKK